MDPGEEDWNSFLNVFVGSNLMMDGCYINTAFLDSPHNIIAFFIFRRLHELYHTTYHWHAFLHSFIALICSTGCSTFETGITRQASNGRHHFYNRVSKQSKDAY